MTRVGASPAWLTVALAVLLAAGCDGGEPSRPSATATRCPPPDAQILDLVARENGGSLPEGVRVVRRDCVDGYVVVNLDSTVGSALALLRPTGSGFEAVVVGGEVCDAPAVRQAPVAVRTRLRC